MSWEVVPEDELPKVITAANEGRCVACYKPAEGNGFYCRACDPPEEYSDLEYATRLDGTTMPAPKALPHEYCWCGGEVGARSPGDHLGLGCLANITHNWNAASQESQDLIEAERAYRSPYDCRNCEDSDPGSLHTMDEHCGADKCEPGCVFFAPHPSHPCGSGS